MPRIYKSNAEFYGHIDSVVESMRLAGLVQISDEIHTLLHRTAWTTSSELFGELRLRFQDALAAEQHLPSDISKELYGLIETIDEAWEGANRQP